MPDGSRESAKYRKKKKKSRPRDNFSFAPTSTIKTPEPCTYFYRLFGSCLCFPTKSKFCSDDGAKVNEKVTKNKTTRKKEKPKKNKKIVRSVSMLWSQNLQSLSSSSKEVRLSSVSTKTKNSKDNEQIQTTSKFLATNEQNSIILNGMQFFLFPASENKSNATPNKPVDSNNLKGDRSWQDFLKRVEEMMTSSLKIAESKSKGKENDFSRKITRSREDAIVSYEEYQQQLSVADKTEDVPKKPISPGGSTTIIDVHKSNDDNSVITYIDGEKRGSVEASKKNTFRNLRTKKSAPSVIKLEVVSHRQKTMPLKPLGALRKPPVDRFPSFINLTVQDLKKNGQFHLPERNFDTPSSSETSPKIYNKYTPSNLENTFGGMNKEITNNVEMIPEKLVSEENEETKRLSNKNKKISRIPLIVNSNLRSKRTVRKQIVYEKLSVDTADLFYTEVTAKPSKTKRKKSTIKLSNSKCQTENLLLQPQFTQTSSTSLVSSQQLKNIDNSGCAFSSSGCRLLKYEMPSKEREGNRENFCELDLFSEGIFKRNSSRTVQHFTSATSSSKYDSLSLLSDDSESRNRLETWRVPRNPHINWFHRFYGLGDDPSVDSNNFRRRKRNLVNLLMFDSYLIPPKKQKYVVYYMFLDDSDCSKSTSTQTQNFHAFNTVRHPFLYRTMLDILNYMIFDNNPKNYGPLYLENHPLFSEPKRDCRNCQNKAFPKATETTNNDLAIEENRALKSFSNDSSYEVTTKDPYYYSSSYLRPVNSERDDLVILNDDIFKMADFERQKDTVDEEDPLPIFETIESDEKLPRESEETESSLMEMKVRTTGSKDLSTIDESDDSNEVYGRYKNQKTMNDRFIEQKLILLKEILRIITKDGLLESLEPFTKEICCPKLKIVCSHKSEAIQVKMRRNYRFVIPSRKIRCCKRQMSDKEGQGKKSNTSKRPKSTSSGVQNSTKQKRPKQTKSGCCCESDSSSSSDNEYHPSSKENVQIVSNKKNKKEDENQISMQNTDAGLQITIGTTNVLVTKDKVVIFLSSDGRGEGKFTPCPQEVDLLNQVPCLCDQQVSPEQNLLSIRETGNVTVVETRTEGGSYTYLSYTDHVDLLNVQSKEFVEKPKTFEQKRKEYGSLDTIRSGYIPSHSEGFSVTDHPSNRFVTAFPDLPCQDGGVQTDSLLFVDNDCKPEYFYRRVPKQDVGFCESWCQCEAVYMVMAEHKEQELVVVSGSKYSNEREQQPKQNVVEDSLQYSEQKSASIQTIECEPCDPIKKLQDILQQMAGREECDGCWAFAHRKVETKDEECTCHVCENAEIASAKRSIGTSSKKDNASFKGSIRDGRTSTPKKEVKAVGDCTCDVEVASSKVPQTDEECTCDLIQEVASRSIKREGSLREPCEECWGASQTIEKEIPLREPCKECWGSSETLETHNRQDVGTNTSRTTTFSSPKPPKCSKCTPKENCKIGAPVAEILLETKSLSISEPEIEKTSIKCQCTLVDGVSHQESEKKSIKSVGTVTTQEAATQPSDCTCLAKVVPKLQLEAKPVKCCKCTPHVLPAGSEEIKLTSCGLCKKKLHWPPFTFLSEKVQKPREHRCSCRTCNCSSCTCVNPPPCKKFPVQNYNVQVMNELRSNQILPCFAAKDLALFEGNNESSCRNRPLTTITPLGYVFTSPPQRNMLKPKKRRSFSSDNS